MKKSLTRLTLGVSLVVVLLGVSAPAYATVMIDSTTGDTSAFTGQRNQDPFKATPASGGPTPLTGVQTAPPASQATHLKGVQTAPPASDAQSDGSNVLVNPFKNITSLPTLLTAILDAAINLGSIILVLAFVWIGFQFVRAQGKPGEIEEAKTALLWTIIGGLILFGAKAISMVVQTTVSSL